MSCMVWKAMDGRVRSALGWVRCHTFEGMRQVRLFFPPPRWPASVHPCSRQPAFCMSIFSGPFLVHPGRSPGTSSWFPSSGSVAPRPTLSFPTSCLFVAWLVLVLHLCGPPVLSSASGSSWSRFTSPRSPLFVSLSLSLTNRRGDPIPQRHPRGCDPCTDHPRVAKRTEGEHLSHPRRDMSQTCLRGSYRRWWQCSRLCYVHGGSRRTVPSLFPRDGGHRMHPHVRGTPGRFHGRVDMEGREGQRGTLPVGKWACDTE